MLLTKEYHRKVQFQHYFLMIMLCAIAPNIMQIFQNCFIKLHFLHHCRKLVQIRYHKGMPLKCIHFSWETSSLFARIHSTSFQKSPFNLLYIINFQNLILRMSVTHLYIEKVFLSFQYYSKKNLTYLILLTTII